MKDLIIPVNNEAHSRALVAVVGEETAQVILRAYKAIDSAMMFGYERGLKEAAEASAAKEATDYKAAFECGYKAGYMDAEEGYRSEDNLSEEKNLKDSYDDGYINGVSDARMSPSTADRIVAKLCYADEDFEDFYDEDEFYEGDSGDENDVSAPTNCSDFWRNREPVDKTVYDEPCTKSFLG
jgi:hypothetical protein